MTLLALRAPTTHQRSPVRLGCRSRGTSTFDGQAIAEASLEHLVSRSQCLTLFATHYLGIARDMGGRGDRLVDCRTMSFRQQEEEEGSGGGGVTLLYRSVPGISPSSFGLNVARMAGIPPPVVSRAGEVSRTLSGGSSAPEEVGGKRAAAAGASRELLAQAGGARPFQARPRVPAPGHAEGAGGWLLMCSAIARCVLQASELASVLSGLRSALATGSVAHLDELQEKCRTVALFMV